MKIPALFGAAMPTRLTNGSHLVDISQGVDKTVLLICICLFRNEKKNMRPPASLKGIYKADADLCLSEGYQVECVQEFDVCENRKYENNNKSNKI